MAAQSHLQPSPHDACTTICGFSRPTARTPIRTRCGTRRSQCRYATPEVRGMAMAMERTTVLVTDDPGLDALGVLIDSPDIDVAVFESPAKAYLRIKREKPATVIVYLSIDSATEFLLLTMLKLDPETAGIPIWTCAVTGGLVAGDES